jgi:hypothetical protein
MANFLLLLILPSVKFRVNPWLMLLLSLMLNLISVANASALLILFPLRWVGFLPFTAPFVLPNFIIF